MKVLAVGTSNNRYSINRLLASHAASLLPAASVQALDLNDFEMPLYSDDREEQLGIPVQARRFYQYIGEADALVLSFAEHNGSYTAAYKNLFDWTSRINKAVFQDKPAVYLSTSPGPGGASSVLAGALDSAAYSGARVIASLSVPSFNRNFDEQKGQLNNPSIRQNLISAMQLLHREVVRSGLNRAQLRAL